jgi:hypothetical protein
MSNDNPHDELASPTNEDSGRSRRRLLTGLALGGAGVAGGLVGGTTAVAASESTSNERFSVDCACLGDSWRATLFADAPDEGDLRGSTFFVEGLLYPGGHIPDGDGFVPTTDGAIGHWFCRGHLIMNPGRGEPHIMSNQEYVFGLLGADNLFPSDMITSVGLEGANEDFVRMHRSVTGGTGKYRAAMGECVEYTVGVNSTVMADDPSSNAFNIRFEFDLSMLR